MSGFVEGIALYRDRRKAAYVAEGAVPNGGHGLALSLADEGAERNGFHGLVAKERIAIEADHAVKTLVIGYEIGDLDVLFAGAGGVDEVFLALGRLFADDRGGGIHIYRIIDAALVAVARQNIRGVGRYALEYCFPPLGVLIDNDARARVKGVVSHRYG